LLDAIEKNNFLLSIVHLLSAVNLHSVGRFSANFQLSICKVCLRAVTVGKEGFAELKQIAALVVAVGVGAVLEGA
jgi:hypothetical protein